MERITGAQNDRHPAKQLELAIAFVAANHANADGDDRHQIHDVKQRFEDSTHIYVSLKEWLQSTVWLLGATHHLLNVNAVHFLTIKIPALRGDR